MPVLYRTILLFPRDLGRRPGMAEPLRYPDFENTGLRHVRRLTVIDVDEQYRPQMHCAVLCRILEALPSDCLEEFQSVVCSDC